MNREAPLLKKLSIGLRRYFFGRRLGPASPECKSQDPHARHCLAVALRGLEFPFARRVESLFGEVSAVPRSSNPALDTAPLASTFARTLTSTFPRIVWFALGFTSGMTRSATSPLTTPLTSPLPASLLRCSACRGGDGGVCVTAGAFGTSAVVFAGAVLGDRVTTKATTASTTIAATTIAASRPFPNRRSLNASDGAAISTGAAWSISLAGPRVNAQD